jgi:hypothetical protein
MSVALHGKQAGSALLNAMTLCQLVKAIDDFNGKFGIGGIGDIFLLYDIGLDLVNIFLSKTTKE